MFRKFRSIFLPLLSVTLVGLPAQAAEAISVTYSNVVLDRTNLSVGQSLKVTFEMTSTGLTAGLQPIASIALVDQSFECEEECGSFQTTLVSGSISKGSWTSTITPGIGLPSGIYRLTINIPKLKGVKGVLYTDSKQIIFTNSNTQKTAPVVQKVAFSNVMINKTSISTGQTLKVTFDVATTGLTTGMQPVAGLVLANLSNECEEDCGSSTTSLVSGTLARGSWTSAIIVGGGLPSGTYKVILSFPKLKGVNGSVYYDSKEISLTGSTSQKPVPALPTVAFSNVVVDRNSLATGDALRVTFDLVSTGLPTGTTPIAGIALKDLSSECEEDCGSSTVTLVSGNISKGSWVAVITPGIGLSTGIYQVVLNLPKLKGVKGALYLDAKEIAFTRVGDAKSASSSKKSPPAMTKITCVRGKLVRTFQGVNPKCPSGYTKR